MKPATATILREIHKFQEDTGLPIYKISREAGLGESTVANWKLGNWGSSARSRKALRDYMRGYSPDTLPGSGPEPFADNHGNHPEPFCQQVGMASAKHGFRQIHATRPAQRNGTAIPVGVHHVTDALPYYQPTHVGGGLRSTTLPALGGIYAEQPNPDLAEGDGVPVHDTWRPRYLTDTTLREDWRMGEYEDGQHQQRREHADDDRPNLLSWTHLKWAAFWIAAFIGTAVVGWVFGVMLVRSFL